MSLRTLKIWVSVLEALQGLGTAYYFNYIFFLLQDRFGFGPFDNLRFAVLNGFIFTFSSLYGGRFAQKHGYFQALTLGSVIMIAAHIGGAFSNSVPWLCATMALWTFGMCFIWPTLEGLACEKENDATLPKVIAVYNVIWAGAGAIAYFSGGWIKDQLGWQSIFWLPICLHTAQLVLTLYLRGRLPGGIQSLPSPPAAPAVRMHEASPAVTRNFQKLAWVANPLAYVAQSAIVPLIPEVARRLHLSATWAGMFCSIWMFSRLFSFGVLGLWSGWHYRFRWLLACYLFVIAAFCGILLFSSLWWLALAQIIFGLSIGLIYYSSLYYSMDASDTKGEHGGLHEAAIGVGLCAGPSIGAAALWIAPARPNAAVYAVAATLLCGLGLLLKLRAGRSRDH